MLQPLLPAIPYEVTNDARGQVEVAFVFSKITQLMKLGEHTPHLWAQTQRMGEYLENDATIPRPVTMPPQSCQTEAVRGVIGKNEPAFQRIGGVLRIPKTDQRSAFQFGKLALIARLLGQGLAGGLSTIIGKRIFLAEGRGTATSSAAEGANHPSIISVGLDVKRGVCAASRLVTDQRSAFQFGKLALIARRS